MSPFSINSQAWTDLKPGMPFVASIYQQHVMIVESTVRISSARSLPRETMLIHEQISSAASSGATTRPSPGSGVASISEPTNSPTATFESVSSGDGGLSKGAVAGIAIGSVVGVVLIALLAYIAWVVRKEHRSKSSGSLLVGPYSDETRDFHDEPLHYHPPGQHYSPVEMDTGQQLHELKAQ